MGLLESILYGFISGLSEFLPISSQGHQILASRLFGTQYPEPLRQLIIHIAMIFGICVSCGTYIEKMRREMRLQNTGRRSRSSDRQAYYDLHLLRSAVFPALLGAFIAGLFGKYFQSEALVALFFALNALLVYLPEHMPHGNKDSSKLSVLDGIVIGLCSVFTMLPGLSRCGIALSFATNRGASQEESYHWILILGIPVLAVLVIFDLISIFTLGVGTVTFAVVLGYLLSAIAAFGASIAAIYLMRTLLSHNIFSAFAFYGWGVALLTFILYLAA